MHNRQKGNVGEYAVLAALSRLGTVQPISEQNDPNHWDIYVTLKGPLAHFAVQVKALSQPELETAHLEDWLAAAIPTLLFWWDDGQKKLYWTDPLSFLLRTGGTLGRKKASLNRHADLRALDPESPQSRDYFVKTARALCTVWSDFSKSNPLVTSDEFPVSLLQVVRDPDLLLCLPLSRRLIDTLSKHSAIGKTEILSSILKAARRGLSSPNDAMVGLLKQCGIPEQDEKVLAETRACFLEWCERIPRDRRSAIEKTLWAYDQLLRLLEYRKRPLGTTAPSA